MRTYLEGTNKKAAIETKGNTTTLYSYNTKVAQYNNRNNKLNITGYHSVTTGKHINKFLLELGLETKTKKQMFEEFNLSI